MSSANWRYFVLRGAQLSYYEVSAGGGNPEIVRRQHANPSQVYLPGEGTAHNHPLITPLIIVIRAIR